MKLIIASNSYLPILVDDQYFDELSAFNWYTRKSGNNYYAARGGGRKQIHIHREVLRLAGIEAAEHVDHIDGCGLNNTLFNLRNATCAQNQHNSRRRVDNTSGYKGVTFHKQRQKWAAQIQVRGKHMHLGLFATPEEAHARYMAAATDLHGEFARSG